MACWALPTVAGEGGGCTVMHQWQGGARSYASKTKGVASHSARPLVGKAVVAGSGHQWVWWLERDLSTIKARNNRVSCKEGSCDNDCNEGRLGLVAEVESSRLAAFIPT